METSVETTDEARDLVGAGSYLAGQHVGGDRDRRGDLHERATPRRQLGQARSRAPPRPPTAVQTAQLGEAEPEARPSAPAEPGDGDAEGDEHQRDRHLPDEQRASVAAVQAAPTSRGQEVPRRPACPRPAARAPRSAELPPPATTQTPKVRTR